MSKAEKLLRKIKREGYWYTSDHGKKFVNLPQDTHKEIEKFLEDFVSGETKRD